MKINFQINEIFMEIAGNELSYYLSYVINTFSMLVCVSLESFRPSLQLSIEMLSFIS